MRKKRGVVVIVVVALICLALAFVPAIYFYLKRNVAQQAPLVKTEITYENVITTPTFSVKKIGENLVPFQNEVPFSGYELQEKHTYLDLAGVWQKERVAVNHGLSLEARNDQTIIKIEDESGGRYKPDYDDSSWSKMQIPGIENPPPDRYQDGAWYRKVVSIPGDFKGKYIKLNFEGANYVTDVWINGKWVGSHEGGYGPFSFDVTAYVKYGEKNLIAVRVDNIPWLAKRDVPGEAPRNNKDIVPFKTCDWWNYGGITRDVYLEAVPNVNIVRADVVSEILSEEKAKVITKVVVYNYSNTVNSVKLDIAAYETNINEGNILEMDVKKITDFQRKVGEVDTDTSLKLEPFEVKVLEVEVPMTQAELWTPENPKLYSLGVRVKKGSRVYDECYTQFGLREIKVDSKDCKLLLNNQPVFLSGFARHEVYPGTTGGEYYAGIKGIYEDMLLLKELNSNFLRTAHYPNHPATYILADRVGLLIWEEIPVFWFGSEEFDLQRTQRLVAKQMWLEMIYRDYNSPAIVFWSTCNECGATKERIDFIKDLYDEAYLIDGTRLVVQSAVGKDTRDKTHSVCDLIGITSYFGIFYDNDYYEDTSKALDELHEFMPEKPVLLTEFGVWSEMDLSNAANQVEVAMDTYDAAKEKDFVCGVTWWCAFNWHTMISEPQTMGVIDWQRKIFKPVYYVIQRLYGARRGDMDVAIIGPPRGTHTQGKVNLEYKITDANDLGLIEVSLDGKPLETPMTSEIDKTITVDTTKLEEGMHTLYVKAKQRDGLTISKEYSFLVDNVDELPQAEFNIASGNLIGQTLPLVVCATDDRGIKEVYYKVNGGEYQLMDEMGFDYYVALLTSNGLNTGDKMQITVKVIDTGSNERTFDIDLKADKEEFVSVSLPVNNDWISWQDNARDAADFYNFPAEFLPDSNTVYIHNGKVPVRFLFGDKTDEQNNNMECSGQLVQVRQDYYSKIYMIAVMHNGNEMHKFRFDYKDGTSQTESIGLSDWWVGNNNFGEEKAFMFPYHHELGAKKKPSVGIYVVEADLDSKKMLRAIRFPVNPKVHIFAVTLEK
jgi:beta-glucuronidase